MNNADKMYFEALASLRSLTRPNVDIFSTNKERIAACKSDIEDALEAHGIDLIIQAMMLDLEEDIALRKKAGIEHRIAEKKREFLGKALYCSVRNADKPVEDADVLGDADE